uniref:Uncharacterized protein n=1 Tax=Romanomermis culicivorax TaxID=13658 RepID=A0A915KCU5_ROMCU
MQMQDKLTIGESMGLYVQGQEDIKYNSFLNKGNSTEKKIWRKVSESIDELNAKTGAAIAGTDIEIIFSYDEHGRGLHHFYV